MICVFCYQAYRLEPLLLKHYANYKPVKIHRHDASKREDYESLPLTPINNDAVTVVDTNHVPEEAELQAKEEDNGDVTINAENEKADVKMKTSPTTKGKFISFVCFIHVETYSSRQFQLNSSVQFA